MNTPNNTAEVLPLELLDLEQDSKLRREGYLTYGEWIIAGRQVVAGATARKFNSAGKALFHKKQTTHIPVRAYYGEEDDSERDRDEAEFMGFDIMDFGCRD